MAHVRVMKTRNEPTEDFESLEDAARRLLAGLKRAKKQVAVVPVKDTAEIQNSAMPLAEKEAGEAAAISASFTGQVTRLRLENRRGSICHANDNWSASGVTRSDPDEAGLGEARTARPRPLQVRYWRLTGAQSVNGCGSVQRNDGEW